MKKIILYLNIIFIFFIFWKISFASWVTNSAENTNNFEQKIEYNIDIPQEIENSYRSEVSINTDLKIDLTNLNEQLKILNPSKDFTFSWSIVWNNSEQNWPIFSRNFNEKWEKEINLTIYEKENSDSSSENKILYNKTLNVLVFEKSIPLVYSDEINKDDIDNYIEYSKKDWIFIYKVWPLNNKSEIELTNILSEIDKYQKIPGLKSDYVTVWWNRDFLFNILSKINRELSITEQNKVKYNIVAISPFNINVLEWYVKNFLADKTWINKLILVNENSKFLILKENLILWLKSKLVENKYNYIDVNLKLNKVSNYLLISKFINNLSNSWYSTNNIYLFLVIPLILTAIVFSKHFIWISPIWIMIPLFITLMFLKLGYLVSLFLILFFVIFNFCLWVFLSRFNLLYWPKMTLSLLLNIICFIILLNLSYYFKIISLDLNDIMYFVVFIIICERFINILVSKDISEYKMPFVYTIFVASVCFWILNLSQIQLLILAFPEWLLILIPINFLIWKFSWLRITEYFRFREIIKSVEE